MRKNIYFKSLQLPKNINYRENTNKNFTFTSVKKIFTMTFISEIYRDKILFHEKFTFSLHNRMITHDVTIMINYY